MADTEDEDDSGINITLGKLVAYPIGILLVLSGLFNLLVSVAGGAIILVSGIIALPIVRGKIKAETGVGINRWAASAVVIVFALLGGGIVAGSGLDTGNTGVDDGSTAETGDATQQEQQQEQQEDNEPETITHQIGDTFTVGEGDDAIQYTVKSAETYEAVGGEFTSQEPNGIFLVVETELTNQGSESFSVTSNAYSAVDSEGNSFDADTEAGIYIEQDSRVDGEAISFEQLNPGLSTDGVLVFDVPEGEEMRLRIEPTGWLDTGNTHEVELGST